MIWDPDHPSTGTYYVDRSDPACSNTGPGTEAQPYCTISAAVGNRGGPGVTILVKPGVYPEQVMLKSGAPNAPFQLRALPGVVVDGADLFSDPAKWVQVSGNVWLAPDVTWNPAQVFADGARLAASNAQPASLPARSFVWAQGAGLYVNGGGGNPATHQAMVGHRANGFTANHRSWATVDGFTVMRTEDRGIYLLGSCANVTLTHNTVRFANKAGIQAVGGLGLILGSNVVSDNKSHGIALTEGVSGSTLEDNESFRNAKSLPSVAGIYLSASPGNTLRRNRLHDNQDCGLHIESGSNNCVSYLNASWNNGGNGYHMIAAKGAIHVCDVAYGNRMSGFSVQSGSTGARIYDSIASNNGLPTNAYDLWVDGSSVSGFASDYNLFWNSTSQPPVSYASSAYSSVSAYGAQSGQDAQTLQVDPRFVNPAAGDLHLQAGSPAIDNASSGVNSWPALDAAGRPRADDPAAANAGTGPVKYADRGAFEFVPADQAPLVFAPASVSIPEGSPLTVTVYAADADGQPIASLAADLTGLPPVQNAVFTVGPADTTGTLSWTPGYGDAGTYTVTFSVANNFSSSTAMAITVTNTDRAPIVATPPATVAEGTPLTLTVHAADPDGQAIMSLAADPSTLPSGATFTAAPGDTSGTLSWTPGYGDAGTYTVMFTAVNALSGSAGAALTVTNVDRAPVVTAPATAAVAEGTPSTLAIHAADPDGDAITSPTADLSALPSGATFSAGPDDTTGTLSWTPSYGDSGTYTVTFTAANALSDTSSTVVTVTKVDRVPIVTAPAA
ncbi:MAG: hypothetical protein DMD82_02460, partial [Candidatus Rokuibacteriota bacterium]